ncbi:hypothetical protein MTY59_29410 [Mycobacterium senriense]|uniref:Uncharacterized protein n=1 Tax=Mycobacterium senriense TaxID=2775496 RepID=A0ABM7SSS2_9MYCO|nr:hypothetical protein MTY59_29410 [Mycobacterium senriense]
MRAEYPDEGTEIHRLITFLEAYDANGVIRFPGTGHAYPLQIMQHHHAAIAEIAVVPASRSGAAAKTGKRSGIPAVQYQVAWVGASRGRSSVAKG